MVFDRDTLLSKLLSHWLIKLHHLLMIGVFLDLKKAFDTVTHFIFIRKMYAYGIRGYILKWFESYLADGMLHMMVVIRTHLFSSVEFHRALS